MSNNIKVAIRVRSLIQREKNEKSKEQWEVNQNYIYPIDTQTRKKNGDSYLFDHIFDSKCGNKDIYETVVHPVVDAAINGFNSTVFAYGQTSSGKTHTMMGNEKQPGVISLAVENIFEIISRLSNRKFLLRVSYMEIYNEKIYDLIDTGKNVKVNEDSNGDVVVSVKYVVTDTVEKVFNVMKKGDKARKIGETSMNEKSSRSHTIFRIVIESTDVKDTNGVVNIAQLNLVDLAGSERPTLTKATGLRLKEGAHINKSLSVLSLVMKQLSESQEFVNFRDSKLTRILQSSLGGNALTAIICAVTPAALEETHSTLAFASRAKTIKNKPHQNEILTDEALITRYAIQVVKLKQELEKATVHNQNLQVDQHEQVLTNTRLRERITLLEKCMLNSVNVSENSSSNTKYRRRTWCSFGNSPASQLPVIYETELLNTKLDCDIEVNKSASNRPDELPFDDCELELLENEKFYLESAQKVKSDEFEISPPVTPRSSVADTDILTDEPEEYVQWLVGATQSPEFVLRQRAAYYEREFNSLKELTKKEKELLGGEQAVELESVKFEFEQLKYIQEYERNVKDEMERRFEKEKKDLLDELDSLIKKNVQLTHEVSQAQEIIQKQNDNECLIEMYRNKYKRREEELLTSLKEARDASNISNKIDITEDVADITTETENFLQTIKCQLTLLRSEIDSSEPIDKILQVLNEIVKNYKSADGINSDSEEVQEFSNSIKFMLEIFSVALNNDNLLQEMEEERNNFKTKLSQVQMAQYSYDVVCREKNKDILNLTEQLSDCKNELDKYIEILNKQENQDHACRELMKEKEKEIEVLSEQIMNYIDELSDVEKTLLKYTSISKSDQPSQTILDLTKVVEQLDNKPIKYEAIIQQKDQEILEYADKLTTKSTQLSELESKFDVYKTSVTKQMNSACDIKTKEYEIVELSNKIIKYLDQISNLKKEVDTYQIAAKTMDGTLKMKNQKLEDYEEQVKSYEEQLKVSQDKIDAYESVKKAEVESQTDDYKAEFNILKVIEMKTMSDQIDNDMEKIAVYEKIILTYESELNMEIEWQKDKCASEVAVKEVEIQSMTDKIKQCMKQITVYEDQIKTDKSVSKMEVESLEDKYKHELVLKDVQIKAMDDKIEKCMKQIDRYEELVTAYKTKLKMEIDVQKNKYEGQLAAKDVEIKSMVDDREERMKKIDMQEQVTQAQVQMDLDWQKDNYENQLAAQELEIKLMGAKIKACMKQITVYEDQIKMEKSASKMEVKSLEDKYKHELVFKDVEIKSMADKIQECTKQIVLHEELIKAYESDFKMEINWQKDKFENELGAKEQEIKTMADKIKKCMRQTAVYKDQIKTYDAVTQAQSDRYEHKFMLKEIERKALAAEVDECMKQMDDYKKQMQMYETMSKMEIETEKGKYENELVLKEIEMKTVTDKIEEYMKRIAIYEYQIQTYETNTKAQTDKYEHECMLKDMVMKAMTEKIEQCITQMAVYEETIKQSEEISRENTHAPKLPSVIKTEVGSQTDDYEIVMMKDAQVKLMSAKIEQYEEQLSVQDRRLKEYEEVPQKEIGVQTEDHGCEIVQFTEKVEMKSEANKSESKKISMMNEKFMQYLSYINKLKAENMKMKHDIDNHNGVKQTMHLEIVELKADLEKTTKVLENEKNELLNTMKGIELETKKWIKVADYLQQQAHEKNLCCESLNKNVKAAQQENSHLLVIIGQLKDELNTLKEKVNKTTATIEDTKKERDTCKEMIHTLENSLGDVQYELHELKYKDKVSRKRIQRQSLQDSSRSLSPSDKSTDTACKCKEYLLELSQYKVRMDMIESQLTAANAEVNKYRDGALKVDCQRCKRYGIVSEQHCQASNLNTQESVSGSSTIRGIREQMKIDELLKRNEHLTKKYEQMKELCKFRKFKLDQFEQQMRSANK